MWLLKPRCGHVVSGSRSICDRAAGVKQQLWGLRLREGATCAVGSTIAESSAPDAKRLGTITSAVSAKAGYFALGYVRCKRAGEQIDLEGQQVYVGGEPAKVRNICPRSDCRLTASAFLVQLRS